MGHVRKAARLRWRFKVVLSSGTSFTVDVSTGGFCTEVMRALPPATPVRGSLEGFGRKVPFAGRVAWSSPGDPSLNLRGRMGISFTEVGAEIVDLLTTQSPLRRQSH